MSGAWRWLLGVERIPPGAAGIEWSFERPLPGWAWLLVVAAAMLLAWRSYRGVQSRAGTRRMLVALRSALLVWIAVLIAGPVVVLPRERREPDRVVVLVDRSASLEIADSIGDGGRAERREEELRSLLAAAAPQWRSLAERSELRWVAFDAAAREIAASEGEAPDLRESPPEGIRTRIGESMRQALEIASGRPVAGIVLVSDGRTSDPPGRSLLRRLEAESIPVFTIALGSSSPPLDRAVEAVEAPARVFARDRVPVAARIRSEGPLAEPFEVRLVDRASGEVLDRVEVAAGEAEAEVILLAEAPESGTRRLAWRVEVDAGDLVAGNDRREFEIEIVDRPLRVLYIEGGPRWEYRFLKNLLLREASVESSIMLLSADREFAQEGDRPIARLPQTIEEFAEHDLVIIGDAAAGFFTPSQLGLLRDLVAVRGAGLLLVGGPRQAPRGWERTPLAEMLPFSGPLALEVQEAPRRIAPTEAARRLGILELGASERQLREAEWAALRWSQRIDPARVKPTAEVLAVDPEDLSPLLLRMRYGAGQVLYLATDETWRWRYGRGETLQERFWIPLLRLLARESAADGGGAARLRASPPVAALGESISLELSITDARAAELGLASASVSVEDPSGEVVSEVELLRGGDGSFSGSWEPQRPGPHRARVSEAALLSVGASAEASFVVDPAREEWRELAADHELLAAISAATGGETISADRLPRLVDAMPDRSVVVADPIIERAWSSPLALLVAVLLLSAEWVARRANRLA